MIDLILKNGLIVTPISTFKADIAIDDGKIEAIGDAALFGKAKRVIDIEGKYVLPGLIDVHTHIEAPFMGCIGPLDFFTASIAGAFGGVTTLIDFTNTKPGDSLISKINERREEMAKCAIDYGIHVKVVEATPKVLGEIKDVVKYGCPSLKMFLTYKKEGVMISDDELLRVMEEAKKWGALPGVHAENNAIIEKNVNDFKNNNTLGWEYFEKSKPTICEKEAIERAILYARYTGSPLYIFHLTSKEGLDSVKEAQKNGQRVFAETCTHYLILTKEKYHNSDGHLFIMSPPLRDKTDREALWKGIKDGNIAIVSSDNCTYTKEEKERFLERDNNGKIIPDFTKVVNGVPGLEERLMLLLGEGVSKGKISLNKLCEISSYNPAKIFGMYPQKGIIQKGSDADLVVVDMDVEREFNYKLLHQKIDYSIYEGKHIKGWPILTISKGKIIVEDGEFKGERGAGKFLKRNAIRL